MDQATQVKYVETLRRLHHTDAVLLLPNAWDAGSAALFAHCGFGAIATTSGGVAWALGHQDGEQVPLQDVLSVVRRITHTVALPVTVDFESGYGTELAQVADAVRALIATGAVGVNLEDGMPGHGPQRSVRESAERIRAARQAAAQAGIPLVINARIDNWMHAVDVPSAPLADALARAAAYRAAGADCLYPIGLGDKATIAAFARAAGMPVNVMAGAGGMDLAELHRIGVARVSTATRFATLALGAMRQVAQQILLSGSFDALAGDFSYKDAQQLFEAG